MERPNTNPDEIDLGDDDFYGDDDNTAEFEDVPEPAMAATMGFTSFGGSQKRGNGDPSSAHSAKKRRFNHQSDEAVIVGAEPGYEDPDNFYDQDGEHDSALEMGEPEPLQQSGIITASKAQLASKTKRKKKPKDDDPDYIDYSDDDDNSNGDNGAADYDNFELDTTLDSDAPSPTRTPIVAVAEEAVAAPPPPHSKPGKKAPAQSAGASKPQPQSQTPTGKATKRAGTPPASRRGGKQPQGQGPGPGQGQTQARPQGRGRTQIDPNWYVDYYVTGSNENPWEKLEVERGMQAVGSWITRAAGPGGGNGNSNGAGGGNGGGDGGGATSVTAKAG